jgi:hypothetical protein
MEGLALFSLLVGSIEGECECLKGEEIEKQAKKEFEAKESKEWTRLGLAVVVSLGMIQSLDIA